MRLNTGELKYNLQVSAVFIGVYAEVVAWLAVALGACGAGFVTGDGCLAHGFAEWYYYEHERSFSGRNCSTILVAASLAAWKPAVYAHAGQVLVHIAGHCEPGLARPYQHFLPVQLCGNSLQCGVCVYGFIFVPPRLIFAYVGVAVNIPLVPPDKNFSTML